MILQALQQYYQRKLDAGDSLISPFGFQQQALPFILEIDSNGQLIQIEDTREGAGAKKTAKQYLVPQGVKKTSGIATNLLWDNAEYVLGMDTRGKPERVVEQHHSFIEKIKALPDNVLEDEGINAVLKFLDLLIPETLESQPLWDELLTNPNLSFKLSGDDHLICQRPTLVSFIKQNSVVSDEKHICLLTGDEAPVQRLHTAIKGVWGAQTAGANIVSFNLDAYNSFGKKQGENAPVSQRAAFEYTTGLNHLLRKGSNQRIQVGDASTVFWAEKESGSEFEENFPAFFTDASKDDPDRRTKAVKSLYQSVQQGSLNDDESTQRFYVLGLAPNAARISIRFWEVASIRALSQRIYQHFRDLEIDLPGPKALPYLPLFRLLLSVATLHKADNIPPNLAGETIRSILTGLPYPQTFLSAAIRRIRAEQSKKDKNTGKSLPNVTYERAAIIKAYLNRISRYGSKNLEEELQVSLDTENPHIGYRLGRLFATLEKIQEEANPGINATIRERYFGAASANPVTVFTTLLKLKNHHLAKLENRGRATNFEKLIGQIIDGLDGDKPFPATMKLEDQGRFAVGYYHQRQDFFKKKETTTEPPKQDTESSEQGELL